MPSGGTKARNTHTFFTCFIENLILYFIQQILSFYIISYKIKIRQNKKS